MPRSTIRSIALAAGFAALAGCAGNEPAMESPDGLVLRPESAFGALYTKPGASLADYPLMGVVPCEVSFRKNWLRDQNSSRVSLTNRVSQDDVDKIEDALALECDKYFREALLQPPPYKLVDEFNDGDKILILRPSIVDLDVSAPDTMSPGMTRTYTTEAGSMTLVLEIYDGATSEILVRVIDKRRSTDYGSLRWSNGVTNKAEADRILKAWSKKLRNGLDAATKL